MDIYKRAPDGVVAKHVKRSNTFMGLIVPIAFLLCNVFVILPTFIFLLYAMNQIFPVLVTVEDLESPTYEPISLEAISTDSESCPRRAANSEGTSRPVSTSIRAMTRRLRASRHWFSLFRGYGWYLLWNMGKTVVRILTWRLPVLLGLLAQVILPCFLVQLNTLWLHTIITIPGSQLSLHNHKPGFKTTIRAAGAPMALALLAEALTFLGLRTMYVETDMKMEHFFPIGGTGDVQKVFRFGLVGAVLTALLVVPSHVLLTRVQVSLLPDSERTVLPLDPALLNAHKGDKSYLSLVEAGRSFSQASWLNLGSLYFKLLFFLAL